MFELNETVFMLENGQITEREINRIEQTRLSNDTVLITNHYRFTGNGWVVMPTCKMFKTKEELIIKTFNVSIKIG